LFSIFGKEIKKRFIYLFELKNIWEIDFMEIKINIKKRYFQILLIVFLIGIFSFYVTGYHAGSFDPNAPNHELLQIIDQNGVSIDQDEDGVIDKANNAGNIFIRWGRTTCPMNTELIYDGLVAGGHYQHSGGGSNTLCLSKNPTWLNYDDGSQNGNLLYGTEYQTNPSFGLEVFNSLYDFDAPCAVCLVEAPFFMHPGSKECPSGWTVLYEGYLMSEHFTYQKSETVCVDKEAESIAGSGTNSNGNLWYPTEAECGSLPCSSEGYVQDREITCSVCVKN